MTQNKEEREAAARKAENERRLAEAQADARGQAGAITAILGATAGSIHAAMRAYRNQG